MKNLNLLFNKTYYRNIGNDTAFEDDCQNFNKKICGVKFFPSDYRQPFLPEDRMQTFKLVTTYPGMLVGTGYAHGTGLNDYDVNIGFSFDYVTGQPYVPGSSVKGLLRSVFTEHPEATAEIIRAITDKVLSTEKIGELEKEIFDFGDIFLDAVVCEGNINGNIMGLDNITPHSEPTKNPKPLLLVKILPGVHFEFRFVLKNGVLTVDEKKELFETMITLFGAGAKTNVGYGQLVRESEYSVENTRRNVSQEHNLGNHSDYSTNRGNNYNNHRTGNQTESANSEDETKKKARCPLCKQKTWIYYTNGKLRTTCSVCKQPINMNEII